MVACLKSAERCVEDEISVVRSMGGEVASSITRMPRAYDPVQNLGHISRWMRCYLNVDDFMGERVPNFRLSQLASVPAFPRF